MMGQIFSYHWLHIPSMKKGLNKICKLSRQDFLELLARWNRDQPGVWQYWE